MSQSVEEAFMPNEGKPGITAAEITPEWIAQVSGVIVEEGFQVRHGFKRTIEIQSQRGGGWLALNLPDNQTHFATTADRDEILSKLTA